MRQLTRLGTFVETISKFLRELKRKVPGEYARVDPEVVRKYVDREGEGCFGVRPFETRKRLPEAADMLRGLVGMFGGTPAEDLESYKLLKRVFDEQCEVDEDDNLRIKPPGEMGGGHMSNPSDPDSTYNGYKGQGYPAQLMESYTEEEHGRKTAPDIITYVDVNKMTEPDSGAVEPALDEAEKRGIKPETLVADTAYGTDANRDEASRRGVEIVAPTQPPKNYKKGRLSLEHFELNEDGLVVNCPVGKSPKTVNAMSNQIDARFEKAVCAACELKDHCPCGIQVKKGRKPRLWYRPDRLKRRQQLLYEQTPQFREKYRWRAGIEATISRLKNWMKLGNLRVRGSPAVTMALRLKALSMNILRSVAYLIT